MTGKADGILRSGIARVVKTDSLLHDKPAGNIPGSDDPELAILAW